MGNCTNCKYQENMCKWPCDDCVKGDKWEEKPFTNADRLDEMTVEEKASFFVKLLSEIFEMVKKAFDIQKESVDLNKNAVMQEWLDWLKQEVNDEIPL